MDFETFCENYKQSAENDLIVKTIIHPFLFPKFRFYFFSYNDNITKNYTLDEFKEIFKEVSFYSK
jgi:hypothetical protein